MNALEERYLLIAISVIVLFVGLYIFSKIKRRKTSKELPDSSLVIVLSILLALFAAQYSQQRPYSSIGVVISVILSVTLVGLLAFLQWPFRNLKIFVKEKRYTAVRFLLVVYLYFVHFAVVIRGFSFLFNGILNPQVVVLTPEFERYVIPTLSGLVLMIYRLTKIFSSKATEFLGEISKDVVVFSLSMSWLDSAVSGLGIRISANLIMQPLEEYVLFGVIVGVMSVGFEGVLLWILNDLSKTGRYFSFEHMLRSMFLVFFSKSEKTSQETLDAYYAKQITRKSSGGLGRAIEILDKRFRLRYRSRVLRASRLLTLAALLMSILFIGSFVAKKPTVVLARGYSVELDLVGKARMPFDATVIVSENMESLDVDQVYAVPIVSIESSNISFLAPLSTRFLSINSSQFMVSEIGQYLVIRLTETYVETYVLTSLLQPVRYDQTHNADFNHQGLFREAEIFYALETFGYDRIITLSITSLQGFIHVVQKSIFASNSTGNIVLVDVKIRAETSVIEDRTCLTSLNENLIDQTIFLIEQTKSITTCVKEIANPTVPFRLVSKT